MLPLENHVNLNQIQFKILKGARWWQLTNQDPKNTLFEISVANMKFDLPYLSSLFTVVEEENIEISKVIESVKSTEINQNQVHQ